MADRTAEARKRDVVAKTSRPSVNSTAASAKVAITPVSMRPPTITNSPIKKRRPFDFADRVVRGDARDRDEEPRPER